MSNVGSPASRKRRTERRPLASRNSRTRIGCSKGVPARREVVLQKSSGECLAQKSVSRVLF